MMRLPFRYDPPSHDPGVIYSVKTPGGINLTICKPAASEGSSSMSEYMLHHWHDGRTPKRPQC